MTLCNYTIDAAGYRINLCYCVTIFDAMVTRGLLTAEPGVIDSSATPSCLDKRIQIVVPVYYVQYRGFDIHFYVECYGPLRTVRARTVLSPRAYQISI